MNHLDSMQSRHAEVYFDPGHLPDRVSVVVVDTLDEVRRMAAEEGHEESGDVLAFYREDTEPEDKLHGALVFAYGHITRAVVVHECVHAGLRFVSNYVMTSPQVQALSEDEQWAYSQEACAVAVEHLFRQVEQLLFPEAQ